MIKNLLVLTPFIFAFVFLAGASEEVSEENFDSFVDFNSRLVLGDDSVDRGSDSRFSSSIFLTNTHSEHKLKLKDFYFVYLPEFTETEEVEASYGVEVDVDDKKAKPGESIEVVVSSFIPSDLDAIFYDDFEVSSEGVLVGRLVLELDLKDDFAKVVNVYLQADNFFEFGKSFIDSGSGVEVISDGSTVSVVPGASFSFTFNALNSLSNSLEDVTFGIHDSILDKTFVSFDFKSVGSSLDANQSGLFNVDAFVSDYVDDGASNDLSFFVQGVDSSTGITYGDVIDVNFVAERQEFSLLPSLLLSNNGYVCGGAHTLPASLLNNGLEDLSNVSFMLEIPGLDVSRSIPVSSLGASESFDYDFAVNVPYVSENSYSARLSGFVDSELMGETLFDFPVSCDDYNVFKHSSFMEWVLLIFGYALVIGGFAFLYSKGFFSSKK